jgi:hypothetical protein
VRHYVAAAGYVAGTQRRFVVCACGEWFEEGKTEGGASVDKASVKHFEDRNRGIGFESVVRVD